MVMSKNDLTEHQARAYRFILENVLETGNCPTMDELRIEMGCSSCNSAVLYVKALRRKGYLRPAGEIKTRIQLPSGTVLDYASAVLAHSHSKIINQATGEH